MSSVDATVDIPLPGSLATAPPQAPLSAQEKARIESTVAFAEDGITCTLLHPNFGEAIINIPDARISKYRKTRPLLGDEGIRISIAGVEGLSWATKASVASIKEDDEKQVNLHRSSGLSAPELELEAHSGDVKYSLKIILGSWLKYEFRVQGFIGHFEPRIMSHFKPSDGGLHVLGLQGITYVKADEKVGANEKQLAEKTLAQKGLDNIYSCKRGMINICDNSNAIIYKWSGAGIEDPPKHVLRLWCEADADESNMALHTEASCGARVFEAGTGSVAVGLELQPKY